MWANTFLRVTGIEMVERVTGIQISGVELTVTYSPHIQVNFLWPNPESIVNGYLQCSQKNWARGPKCIYVKAKCC